MLLALSMDFAFTLHGGMWGSGLWYVKGQS